MAPALTALRDVYVYVTLSDSIQPLPRRALASVNNNNLMDDDAMGLQSQPSLVKDSQDMDQILSDLGNSEIAQADILNQVIKTFDASGEVLSAGDGESMFPLASFDLGEPDNSEGDSSEDKIRISQSRMQGRVTSFLRRLRILQAKAIGNRVAEEVEQTFEKATKGARKDGGGRPMGVKAFVKKVETTAALQASAASRSVTGPKYYHAGTSKGDASKSASLGIPSGTFNELEDKAAALRFHLSVVKKGLDSDATASSSGGESDDEAVPYNNTHQQPMPIEKRALWTYQRQRAKIASNATWIQAQIQELDFKLRLHNDLYESLRGSKAPVELEGEPASECGGCTCARTRPLRSEKFVKRKLLQMHNLHFATDKANKPSDIRCSCQHPLVSCPVCTGRADATQPVPPFSSLAPAERIALADPGYHPVLSDIKDITPAVHMEALSSRPWFRTRFNKAWRGAHHTAGGRPPAPVGTGSPAHRPTPRNEQKQPRRLKRGRPPLSRKVKERDRDEDTSTSSHERGRGRASTETRGWRRQSYDIDNIVIPQSVAASTRPEILTYKEIITPKWRVMELPEAPLNNGVVRTERISVDSEEEDISESAVHLRHARAETRERARYLRKPRSRRAPLDAVDAADASDTLLATADPVQALPEPQPQPHVSHTTQETVTQQEPAAAVASCSTDRETVRPYSPRIFPLPEEVYRDMLATMPDGYRPSSSEPSPQFEEEEDQSSSLSPLSPPMDFDGDDPDDAEWNPSLEKGERRKSGLR